MASGVEGMFAPSATSLQPFFTRISADEASISFWVAQGSAMSHFTVQMPEQPGVKVAPLTRLAYSEMRRRSTSLICLTTSRLMPLGSYTYPLESLSATTLPPSSVAFCVA